MFTIHFVKQLDGFRNGLGLDKLQEGLTSHCISVLSIKEEEDKAPSGDTMAARRQVGLFVGSAPGD
jgi:hypothetical protein